MDIRRFTHIGRPVDPAWPTNRAIAVITLVVGVISGIVLVLSSDLGVLDAAATAFKTAAAVFLAWALTRELDPDHQIPAFVATGLALLGIAITGTTPPLLPMFWLLLLLRVVNRTTGRAPRASDVLLVAVLGALVTATGHPVAGAATGAGLWLNHRLDGRPSLYIPGLALALVLISFLALMAGFGDSGMAGAAAPHWGLLLAAVGASALFVAVSMRSGAPASLDDEGAAPISAHRLRLSNGLGLITGILIISFAGREGFAAFIPFWAAVVAVGLQGLLHRHSPNLHV